MTGGFIDSSSVHGALTAIVLGKHGRWTSWDERNVLDATYLLMHDHIQVIPPPGSYAGAHGFYQQVVSRFPWLESKTTHKDIAERNTKNWLTRYPNALASAWNEAQTDPNFPEWARLQRELFWPDHSRTFGGLFNEEFIPYIFGLMGCSEKELRKVHSLTKEVNCVRHWSKGELNSEEAQLAERAWLLASMVRGKYHEYFARAGKLQLISHPYKKYAWLKLKPGPSLPLLNSEEYFLRMIIGSALLERSPDRRVKVWVDNIAKARQAITLAKITLPQTALDSDAEWHAVSAAKKIGMPSSPAIVRRTLDITVAVGLGLLIGITLSPWASPLGPLAQQAHRHFRDASIGDDLAKLALSTRRRFLKLASSVPGRIESVPRTPSA